MSLNDDLLLYGARIVVPKSMREDTLQKIHQGHQGIQRCCLRVKNSVWWPGVTKDIEALVKSCPECQKLATLPRQPMIKSPLPSYPWEKVASDLFELNKTMYLLVVDYFSRFVEIQKLTSTTYLHKCHHSAKVHICSTWNPSYPCHRQGTTIYLQ